MIGPPSKWATASRILFKDYAELPPDNNKCFYLIASVAHHNIILPATSEQIQLIRKAGGKLIGGSLGG